MGKYSFGNLNSLPMEFFIFILGGIIVGYLIYYFLIFRIWMLFQHKASCRENCNMLAFTDMEEIKHNDIISLYDVETLNKLLNQTE